MAARHPKGIRRELLQYLYDRYQRDPLEMVGPYDILDAFGWTKQEMIPNIHYLHDRKLVELMFGYNPPLFAAARILAGGIDLVEDPFEFNRRFPPMSPNEGDYHAQVIYLVEQLVDEVDFAPVEGNARRRQLRDVQYLRDEVCLPAAQWRSEVLNTLLDWIAVPLDSPEETLPALGELRNMFNTGAPKLE